MDQIAEQLQKLTTQLNEFRLASEQNVGEVQKQISDQFQHRLDLQSERIDLISESANKSQKTAEQILNCFKTCLLVLKIWGKTLNNCEQIWNTGKLQYTKKLRGSMNR